MHIYDLNHGKNAKQSALLLLMYIFNAIPIEALLLHQRPCSFSLSLSLSFSGSTGRMEDCITVQHDLINTY